jgi:hypothetical protein
MTNKNYYVISGIRQIVFVLNIWQVVGKTSAPCMFWINIFISYYT